MEKCSWVTFSARVFGVFFTMMQSETNKKIQQILIRIKQKTIFHFCISKQTPTKHMLGKHVSFSSIPSHNLCLPGTVSCPSRGPSFIYCHLYTATPPRPSCFCRVTSLAMACTSLIFSLLTAPLLLEGRPEPGSMGWAAGTCSWDPKPPLLSVVTRGLGMCHRGVLLDCATV